MELHEILNAKTVAMVKSKLLEGLVFDQSLKGLLERDVQQSIAAAQQIRGMYMNTTEEPRRRETGEVRA
jgi:similar to spore coat protein